MEKKATKKTYRWDDVDRMMFKIREFYFPDDWGNGRMEGPFLKEARAGEFGDPEKGVLDDLKQTLNAFAEMNNIDLTVTGYQKTTFDPVRGVNDINREVYSFTFEGDPFAFRIFDSLASGKSVDEAMPAPAHVVMQVANGLHSRNISAETYREARRRG
jgi:hypothetical protein